MASAAAAQVPELPACGANPAIGWSQSKIAPLQATDLQIPLQGKEAEAEIGQSMISLARLDTYPTALELTTEAHLVGTGPLAGFEVRIPPGFLPVWLSDTDPETSSMYGAYVSLNGVVTKKGKPVKAQSITISTYRNGAKPTRILFANRGTMYHHIAPPLEFKLKDCLVVSEPKFKRELIYSGSSQGVVKLLYREFINDLARPAFTQELTYDLSEGDEIGYKGARFKVVRATNMSIRYIVLKSLDAS